jgi:hypothetical protein
MKTRKDVINEYKKDMQVAYRFSIAPLVLLKGLSQPSRDRHLSTIPRSSMQLLTLITLPLILIATAITIPLGFVAATLRTLSLPFEYFLASSSKEKPPTPRETTVTDTAVIRPLNQHSEEVHSHYDPLFSTRLIRTAADDNDIVATASNSRI